MPRRTLDDDAFARQLADQLDASNPWQVLKVLNKIESLRRQRVQRDATSWHIALQLAVSRHAEGLQQQLLRNRTAPLPIFMPEPAVALAPPLFLDPGTAVAAAKIMMAGLSIGHACAICRLQCGCGAEAAYECKLCENCQED